MDWAVDVDHEFDGVFVVSMTLHRPVVIAGITFLPATYVRGALP